MLQVLNLSYSKILMSDEIEETINPVNKGNREYLRVESLKLCSLWIVIALILLISFYVGVNRFGAPQITSAISTVGVVSKTATPLAIKVDAPTQPNKGVLPAGDENAGKLGDSATDRQNQP